MRNRPVTTFQPGDRVHLKGHAHTPATTGTVTEVRIVTIIFVRWDDNDATTPHHPHHLEPAGEPMSKTFESIVPGSKATIEVAGVDGSVTVYVHQNIGAIDLDAAHAPALALAILEAAGVQACAKEFGATAGTMAQLEDIAWALADYSNAKALEAEQAADREALEVEALHLCRILWDNPDQAWTPMSPEAKAKWLKMARTARELHGVTK